MKFAEREKQVNFLCGLSNSKTADALWRIFFGQPPTVWLVWCQTLSSLNWTTYSPIHRIYLRVGMEMPLGILVSLEHRKFWAVSSAGVFSCYEPYCCLRIWMSFDSCKRTCFIFRFYFAMFLNSDTTENPEVCLFRTPQWEACLENALIHVYPDWNEDGGLKLGEMCLSDSSLTWSQVMARPCSNTKD